MEVKYHTQFLLDKEKNRSTAKIRYRIKWDKNIVAFNLGYRVEIDKWSLETQRCKTNTTHGEKKIAASIINKKIREYESACENVFRKFELEEITPDKINFKNYFNIEIGKPSKTDIKSELTFFEIFDQFIIEESRNNHWKIGTTSRMYTQRKKLNEFNENLDFSLLDEDGLSKFQEYLESKNHKNTTIAKSISLLKWFLRWAKKKSYNKNTDFEIFKPKIKNAKKKIIFLTQNELKQLTNYIIPQEKEHLEKIRDVFLFQCFTGLRYSDVYNLKKSDIKENHIEITTVKTLDNLIIELNTYSRNILKKYEKANLALNKPLPVISNQKMNNYLKEIVELAGIDEMVTQTFYRGNKRVEEVSPKYSLIGTHAARRTFICNALSLGIAPQVVMKWTGHNDYKAMKPYIDIADDIKVSAMEKFNLL